MPMTPRIMPMIKSTTATSISVKPRERPGPRAPKTERLVVPRADLTFAIWFAARSITEDIYFAMHAGVEILVIVSPGILRQTINVAAGAPIVGNVTRLRFLHQRLQALLGARIAAVIQSIKAQSAHNGAYVASRRHLSRIVRSVHDLRHDDSGQ